MMDHNQCKYEKFLQIVHCLKMDRIFCLCLCFPVGDHDCNWNSDDKDKETTTNTQDLYPNLGSENYKTDKCTISVNEQETQIDDTSRTKTEDLYPERNDLTDISSV